MASTQKKTKGTQRKTQAKTSGKPKGIRKKELERRQYLHRVEGAVGFFLLAVFVILGIFQMKAVFIDLLCQGIKGLIGYGFWITAPVFLFLSYLLISQRNQPIQLRGWCAGLLPVSLGCLQHLYFCHNLYPLKFASTRSLWEDGLSLKSGGAISGLIAEALTSWFSKIGATVILVMIILCLVFAAFRLNPKSIVNALRWFYENRYEEEWEDEYEEENLNDQEEPQPKTIRREVVDIPLDEKQEEKPVKKSLFNRVPRVKRPHEVLSESVPKEEVSSEAIKETISVVPTDEAIPQVVETMPVDSAVPERNPPIPTTPEKEKVLTRGQKKELIREEQEKVAYDIESGLEMETDEYQYPPISLLNLGSSSANGAEQDELNSIQKRLSETIQSFGIDAQIVGAVRGPSVTRYEVELEQGVRLNKLTNLSDDIALSLGASSVRIAPVPGKISLVGIEVPNLQITPVWVREVISSKNFVNHPSRVSFSVGKDIGGNYIVGDVSKLPHLLIAGTTGSGKSVCTNSLIISLLYKATPEEVRLIMVDPKMVELGVYNGIPHLLIPVVTDPKKAAGALQWAVAEMMKRYRTFAEVGVRELASYNAYAEKHEGIEKLPQIVVVIDELADLMMVAAKEVEESICRVAQMGRASGMHLIIATQRPSADVITGLMKANIPSRIAFAVASSLESRIILDTQGAEKLVGKGDMLWVPLGSGKPLRVQGCLITEEEVASVVEFVKTKGSAEYDQEVLQQIEKHVAEQDRGGKHHSGGALSTGAEDDSDELFPSAVEIVLDMGQASVSMLQRRLKLGYSRAARLVDQMEERGIVGPFEGSKPRQLLITKEQWKGIQDRGQNAKEPDPVVVPVEGAQLPTSPEEVTE